MFTIFLNQRKQAKLQWLQEQSQINADNLKNVDMKLVGIPGTKECNV